MLCMEELAVFEFVFQSRRDKLRDINLADAFIQSNFK